MNYLNPYSHGSRLYQDPPEHEEPEGEPEEKPEFDESQIDVIGCLERYIYNIVRGGVK